MAKTRRDSLSALRSRVDALERALTRARHAGVALRRVSQAVGRSRHIDGLLELIVDTAIDVVRAERGTLYLRDGRDLVSRVKTGDETQPITIAVGQGLAGHVAKTGRSLRVDDAYSDPRFDPAWDKKSGYRTRSILTHPLRLDHTTVGVLQVLNKLDDEGNPTQFTRYDSEVLRALASQAAVSVDKANLFRRLVEQNEQLQSTTQRLERSLRDKELLYELETAMSRAENLPQLARKAIALTAQACGASAGALLYKHQAGQATLYVVSANVEGVRAVEVQPGEGIAGRAMASGELLIIDSGAAVRDPERVRELLGIKVGSAIAMPLRADDGRVNGAMALYNHSDNDGDAAGSNPGAGKRRGRRRTVTQFGDDDAALLRLVSANVSTELRIVESRRQRERAERLGSLGQVLSGIMHDLRTPLAVVSGHMQLMAVEEDGDARTEHMTVVRRQFAVIEALQQDVLAYARGETTLLVRKVMVPTFLQRVARQFEGQYAEAGITLELRLDARGAAYFDEARIARALHNLLRNAADALDGSEGRVELRARAADDDLLIEVSDDGPGIPRSIRRRVFKPFVTAGKKTGTGLGLSIVKEIVEEHGGTASVKSSRTGTCFTLRLPRALSIHRRRRED